MGETWPVKVRYTQRAIRQLDAILTYIAEQSPQGAGRVFDRIEAILGLLCEQPHMGRRTIRPGFRRIIVNPYPYSILYQPTATAVVIHSVRHTSQKTQS